MRAVVLIIALFGCGAALQPRSDACIVTAQQAHDLYAPGDRYFTPSDADVRAMQTWLGAYLRGKDGTDHIVERLARYRGVVYGLIVNGHHVLRASYSCSAHGPCSEDVGTISLDGGDCNFDVDFDLDTRRYTYLSVSGIASTDERRPTRPPAQCALGRRH